MRGFYFRADNGLRQASFHFWPGNEINFGLEMYSFWLGDEMILAWEFWSEGGGGRLRPSPNGMFSSCVRVGGGSAGRRAVSGRRYTSLVSQ